jgi:hypothetical protein
MNVEIGTDAAQFLFWNTSIEISFLYGDGGAVRAWQEGDRKGGRGDRSGSRRGAVGRLEGWQEWQQEGRK